MSEEDRKTQNYSGKGDNLEFNYFDNNSEKSITEFEGLVFLPTSESTFSTLVFGENDSPSNVILASDGSSLKAASFSKLIEKLTNPKIEGTLN